MNRLTHSLRSLLPTRRRPKSADLVRSACTPVVRQLACFDTLESRQLMSASYSSGALTITLAAATQVYVATSGGNVVVTENGATVTITGGPTVAANAVTSINVTGSTGNDYINLYGVTAAAGFSSLDGLVTITGGDGNDTLSGSAFADSIAGGDGNDAITGKLGNDTLDGGAGNNSIDFGYSTVGVTVYLAGSSAGTAAATGASGDSDTIYNFLYLTGSNYNDLLVGDANNNAIAGAAGNDTILGGDGNDLISGGTGDDSLDGEAGNDSLNCSGSSSGVSVNFSAGSATSSTDGTDTITSFSKFNGSNYADYFVGDNNDNYVQGLGGDDTLIGGGGNDNLIGGDGTDTVSYASSTSGVTVTVNGSASDGLGGTDTLATVENVIGSPYADSITGDSGNNVIDGGDGNDTLAGAGGNDYVTGGNGNDSVTTSAGNDTLHGASGTDTVVITGGTLTADAAQTLASLSISTGARLTLQSGTGTTVIQSLTLAGTGALDTTNNSLVIDYTGSTPLSAIRAALAAGRNGGAWNGSGILSSTAAADPDLAHAIGYIEASDLLGGSGGTFAGRSVDGTALLLKYTWYGDANLDGHVNLDDYGLYDRGLAAHLTAWVAGDFNYDATINGDDGGLLLLGYVIDNLTPATDFVATAMANTTRIILTWDSSSPVTSSFNIDRSTDGGVTYTHLADVDASDPLTYSDVDVTPGASYTYRITATNGGVHYSTAVTASATTSTFVTYNGMGFIGQPDTQPYGVPFIVAQEVQFFDDYDTDKSEPSETATRAYADSVANTYGDVLVIINIEHWQHDIRRATSQSEVEDTIDKFVNIVQWMHDEVPGIKVGIYQIGPVQDYWTPVQYANYSESDPEYAEDVWLPQYEEWQAANDFLAPIAAEVDFICPSLYAPEDNPAHWEIYAQANLAEAARYGKPVLAYLSMRYSGEGDYLPAEDFADELEFVRNQNTADGIIIWGGFNTTWDGNAEWWTDATLPFLTEPASP